MRRVERLDRQRKSRASAKISAASENLGRRRKSRPTAKISAVGENLGENMSFICHVKYRNARLDPCDHSTEAFGELLINACFAGPETIAGAEARRPSVGSVGRAIDRSDRSVRSIRYDFRFFGNMGELEICLVSNFSSVRRLEAEKNSEKPT